MANRIWLAALLCAALSAAPLAAQTDPAAEPEADTPMTPEEAASQVAFLQAQIEALQAQVDTLKKAVAQATPVFSPGPQVKSDNGFSFRPNGEIQYDAGTVSRPANVVTPNLGFNNRARRLLIGASGDLPGNFKYSFQFNFAQSTADFEDVVFSYEPKGKPVTVTIGYFYPYNTLENLTSNRFLSFVERAQMTDAFAEGRRLGVGLGFVSGDFRANAGMFAGTINNANFDNDDYQASARLLYAPLAFGGQLHFAAAAQFRHFRSDALGIQYRARPFTQLTDQRFADAAGIAAKGDRILGLEALGIFGPVHVQSEAQWVKTNGYRPGTVKAAPTALAGTLLASDPNFFSVYGEAGIWLTGETRGYRNGRIDRTKIVHGFDQGGWGGVQLVGRVDYLDLRDKVGGANVATQVVNGVLNGGRQTGYLAALNWWPIDYVRFTAQYTRADIEGGPRAGVVDPASTKPIYDRKYHSDVAVVRAQIDF